MILLVFCLSVLHQACHQPVSERDEKLRVVTTIAPLFSFTVNVAGESARVANLIPSGVGPHEYSLSPDDARKISQSQVLILNGVNLESWVYKVAGLSQAPGKSGETDRNKPVIVDTSAGVEIIGNDPHIWLSPRNAIIQVRNISDALMKADPENRKTYAQNADEYIERLRLLDRAIEDEIRTLKMKQFVAYHSAFRYFARDYGLEQVAVIQESPEREPSPRHIAHVIETIKSKGIRSIFTEPQFSHKIVESIAGDLNLQVYSLDTLETGAFSRAWYEESMRSNLEVFTKALDRSN